jgi:hypothetical protein
MLATVPPIIWLSSNERAAMSSADAFGRGSRLAPWRVLAEVLAKRLVVAS